MELHILFDALRSLESLSFNDCIKLCELPDNISSLSLLRKLYLDTTSLESLPTSIKHLSMLRSISVNNCWKLRSIPELPPNIDLLHVQYCPSLVTIFPLTSLVVENTLKRDRMNISFKDCEKLEGQSLCNVMKLSHLSLMKAIYGTDSQIEACYPGSTVPKWFRYKAITGDSFTIELPQIDSDQLLGFMFCGIIPQFPIPNVCEICFKILDQEEYKMRTSRDFPFQKLFGDHVFLWYRPYEPILCKSGRRKYDDESITITCKFTCILYDQSVEVIYARMTTACGVCPIYASNIDNIIEQILESSDLDSGSNTKRHRDFDDHEEQLSPVLKESRTNVVSVLPVGLLELELPTLYHNSPHITDDNLDEQQPHFQTTNSE